MELRVYRLACSELSVAGLKKPLHACLQVDILIPALKKWLTMSKTVLKSSLRLLLAYSLWACAFANNPWIETTTDLKIFAFTNYKESGPLRSLEAQAVAGGFTFEHLYLPLHHYHHGHKLKVMRMMSCNMDQGDLVVFLDAADVYIAGNASHVRQQLDSIAAASNDSRFALSNAEKGCWPDGSLAGEYPATLSPWKYLNAGAVVAPAGLLCDLLHQVSLLEDTTDDQGFWTDMYLHNNAHGKLELDHGCGIFQSTYNFDETELLETKAGWVNTVTGSLPVFFHGNAGGSGLNFVLSLASHVDHS